eukprot:2408732-Prymnesium_polylepis.1
MTHSPSEEEADLGFVRVRTTKASARVPSWVSLSDAALQAALTSGASRILLGLTEGRRIVLPSLEDVRGDAPSFPAALNALAGAGARAV